MRMWSSEQINIEASKFANEQLNKSINKRYINAHTKIKHINEKIVL